MMVRRLLALVFSLLLMGAARAQDGLNLPTDLFVLTNSGTVQRYGLGTEGIRAVTPDDQFVIDFGVAPDGNWIAYRTEGALTFANMYTDESDPIEGVAAGIPPTRGRGDTIVWSPTADALAYTTAYGARVFFTQTDPPVFADLREGQFRQLIWSPDGDYLAAEAEQTVWWLYRREGNTLLLTSAIPSSVGLAWTSPSEVVFAPADGGLIRMNLAEANRQTLLLDATWVYSLPYLLADGTLAVFGRQQNDTETEPGFGRLLGLSPDAPQVTALSEILVDTRDLRWAPGGELMVAFRGGVLALVSPATGQGLTLPVADAVAYSWGAPRPPAAERLLLPADAYFRTLDSGGIRQIWRLPGGGGPAEPVTQATADVTAYAISPDERRIGYVSDSQIWLQSLTGTDSVEALGEPVGAEIRRLTFSPDATRLAYDTLGDPSTPTSGIWVLPADGSSAAELVLRSGPAGDQAVYAPPFYYAPQFAPNANRLLVASGEGETTSYGILDLSTGALTHIGAFDGAIWLRDGRILGYGTGIGLNAPPTPQPLTIISADDPTQREAKGGQFTDRVLMAREIATGQVRLVLTGTRPGPRPLRAADVYVERTGDDAVTFVAGAGFMVGPLLAPDGLWLAGQLYPGGPLALRNLRDGSVTTLAEPSGLDAFQWTR